MLVQACLCSQHYSICSKVELRWVFYLASEKARVAVPNRFAIPSWRRSSMPEMAFVLSKPGIFFFDMCLYVLRWQRPFLELIDSFVGVVDG